MKTRFRGALPGFFAAVVVLTAVTILPCTPHASGAPASDSFAARVRQPVAVAVAIDQPLLYVANRKSGSISVVDLETRETVGEFAVGKRLSDLKITQQGILVVTDEEAHELIIIGARGGEFEVLRRLAVPPYPVSVVVTHEGRRCCVASLWSRRLAFVELSGIDSLDAENEGAEHRVESVVVDLPFAPRCQLPVRNDSRLIVADSFSGRLAVVDSNRRAVLHVREFPGHNIRGLGLSSNGQMLIVAHQMLNELAHTVRNDVHWGLLMSNDLRWLKLDSVLDADADLYTGAHMHPLGGAGSATGDPAGLAVGPQGTVVVSLGGVGEVAVGEEHDFSLQRLSVGRRPMGLAIHPDGKRAFIANTFSDSVSVIDLEAREAGTEIALGPAVQPTLADRGEQLFFDASLSHDSWMSCHSCHSDGHTNGMLNDNFSDGSFGAPKRVLSLLGRAPTAPFSWAGSAPDLPTQIRKSIVHTMQSDREPSDKDVEAIAAYLKTLQPPPSIDRMRGREDRAAVERGRAQFRNLGCVKCHAPPAYTTPGTYDVNLADKLGKREYNPPSLLGVGQRGPYFHDGRAPELGDVFREFSHQLERELQEGELDDLLAFLRSL